MNGPLAEAPTGRDLDQRSLDDLHSTVPIPRRFWARLFAFTGPAYMVSVGYMDPGNWGTDIEGGARFGYRLLWVLLMSNLMAVLLQTLSARLGIVTGHDLAQLSRTRYSRPARFVLWILCEIAIAACDLAEVLGTVIGLNLLFGMPMLVGLFVTAFDTLLLLSIQRLGIRKMEAFILVLISTIGVCFLLEVIWAKPAWSAVAGGFVPRLDRQSLYIAIGILGATVMPHNLYLHSALVQTRRLRKTPGGMREACRFNLIDSIVALNAAFFVNAAILIVAAAAFYYGRQGSVGGDFPLQRAHTLLQKVLGTNVAGFAFAVALLCSGQSSTLTGTLAGQIVMEGFVEIRLRPWLRRLTTRALAILPAILVLSLARDHGEHSATKLLILSQVVLSLQLPFAVVPLIQLTGDRALMGPFANPRWVKVLAWLTAAIIVGLNGYLVYASLRDWIEAAGPSAIGIWISAVPVACGLGLFLLWMVLAPVFQRVSALPARVRTILPGPLGPVVYRRIGVTLELGGHDQQVIQHALALARSQGGALFLIHVVEGVSAQWYGTDAEDRESRDDRRRLRELAEHLETEGVRVVPILGFGSPPEEVIRITAEQGLDLLVMGVHGHRWGLDLLRGSTANPVRHGLKIPILMVRGAGGEDAPLDDGGGAAEAANSPIAPG